MKLSSLLFFAVLSFGLISCGEDAPKEKVNNVSQETNEAVVDPTAGKLFEIVEEESFVNWTGSKPTESHNGTLKVLPGAFEIKGNLVQGGEIIVDMMSMTVTDIKDEESNAKLLGHLKSPDFFAVDEYTEARLIIAESMMNDTAKLMIGTMEIKGINHPAEIRYEIKNNGSIAVVSGTYTFDRTMYEIKYKSKTIFPDLADKFINDDIKLDFNIVLKEAKID